MGYRSNIPQVISRMQRIPAKIEKRMIQLVTRAILRVDEGVHEKTPVWSGLAIRNMIWTKSRPNSREFDEIKSGEVTDEGRRAANAAAARQTRDGILKGIKPFGVWYLSNASKHIFELEAGMLPSPERTRVPSGGMFGLTFAEVRNSIGT